MLLQIKGKNFYHFDSISSTNSHMLELLSKFKPFDEGTVILADEQTQGRGQQGTHWESNKAENLTFSLYLCPSFLEVEKQFNLSKIICLAIQKVIQSKVDSPVEIKWPNDVYVSSKKIAGILIETVLMNNILKHVVVGIGINVNQTYFKSNTDKATSLKLECGSSFDRLALLEEVLDAIDEYYQQLKNKELASIHDDYLNKLLNLRQARYYMVNGEKVLGKIIGIDEHGRLELIINGNLFLFSNKEIEFILQ